jgi:hypothetical protein
MDDDDLTELARALRETAGRELRADAGEVEHLAQLQRRRRADLAAAVRMAMHRGDQVTASVAGRTFRLPLVAVGHDYMRMAGEESVYDVRLDAAILTVRERRSGGTTGTPPALTLRARLAELEQLGSSVEVLTRVGGSVVGSLSVVAPDHVVLAAPEDATVEVVVPVDQVAVVVSRLGPRGL